MFARIKAYLLKKRTLKLLEKTASFYIASRYSNQNELFLECAKAKCSPEGTILDLIEETLIEAESYYDCDDIKIKLSDGKETASIWYYIARRWMSEGSISQRRLDNFIDVLDTAKSRWPELFNGESPFLRKYWEVHFDYTPAGISTTHPSSKPVATFDTFSEATQYVVEHSDEEYWWHSYDLFEAAKNGNIPEWEAMPAPKVFNRIDKPGFAGYNPYWHVSSDCIFATHKDSYLKWRNAVTEYDIYRVNKVKNGCIYNYVIDANSWCVRYVEHEEPIDNKCSDANIPDVYSVSRCD